MILIPYKTVEDILNVIKVLGCHSAQFFSGLDVQSSDFASSSNDVPNLYL